MRPTYSAEAEAYREKVQAFLAEKLPPEVGGHRLVGGRRRQRVRARSGGRRCSRRGYLAPGWPTEYGGGGLSALEQVIIAEEFAKAGVPTGGPNDVFGIQMLGNTLLQWGTDEQKNYYLPRILSGEDTWCQGYSRAQRRQRPRRTSACAACSTATSGCSTARRSGRRPATSPTTSSRLVRTDPDAPKHKGISFILVDMRQPGIEVRPIKMISGESEFNEVFYTDATAPKDEVVGGVNNGWAVAMTLLGYERGEAAATVPIRFQAEIDRLMALAKESRAHRRSRHPPAAGVVLQQGRRSCATSACAR